MDDDAGESLAFDLAGRRTTAPRRASDVRAIENLQDQPLEAINVNSNTFGREHRLARILRERILSELSKEDDEHDELNLRVLDRSVRTFLAKNAVHDEEGAWKKVQGEIAKLRFVLDELTHQQIVHLLCCHDWSSSLVLLEHVYARLDEAMLDSLSPAELSSFAAKVKASFKKRTQSGMAGSELLDAVALACQAELEARVE